MQKVIIYKAYNGVIIIDDTPEAEIRLSNIKYAEERVLKERRRIANQKQRLVRNILRKVACFMV